MACDTTESSATLKSSLRPWKEVASRRGSFSQPDSYDIPLEFCRLPPGCPFRSERHEAMPKTFEKFSEEASEMPQSLFSAAGFKVRHPSSGIHSCWRSICGVITREPTMRWQSIFLSSCKHQSWTGESHGYVQFRRDLCSTRGIFRLYWPTSRP